jgi:hypothetical protein
MNNIWRVFLCGAATLVLSGCVNISLQVDLTDEKKPRFTETLSVDTNMTSLLNLQQPPGDRDLWHRAEEYARKNNWQYTQKTTNNLQFSGAMAAEQLRTILTDQAAFLLEGYGIEKQPGKQPLLLDFNFQKQDGLFNTKYSGQCNYDFTKEALLAGFRAESNIESQTATLPEAKLKLAITVPGTIDGGNATVSADKRTAEWNLTGGSKGRMHLSYTVFKIDTLLTGVVLGILLTATLALGWWALKTRDQHR